MSENPSPLDLNTLWVECKNADGRVSVLWTSQPLTSFVFHPFQTYFYNAKSRQTTWIRPEGQRIMSQSELDQLLPKQSEVPARSVSPSASTPNNAKAETARDTNASPDEPATSNYNPYSYPPPSFGMPFGGIPPHLMPHMAQMMQNGSWGNLSPFSSIYTRLRSGFPGFGSIPPPAHLLRFMMPPLVNPAAVTAGKSLETLQTELRKVSPDWWSDLEYDRLSA